MQVLISAEELAAALRAGAVTVLDVRWALGDSRGWEHYLDGHIPSARFVDLEKELAAPPEPLLGRHPLPTVDDLQAAARRWGVWRDRTVVCYDATGNLAAARAWWLLRWGGLADVLLLDGGLDAWTEAGFPLSRGEPEELTPGDVVLEPGKLPVLTADEAEDLAANGVLLDARAAERYRGEDEPVDPRAGHIPGAVSAPTAQNLSSSGRFLSEEELAQRFSELGAASGKPVGVYCGSGVTAAHELAALAIAGIDGALFAGSWSAWSSDPERPVATGEEPGA